MKTMIKCCICGTELESRGRWKQRTCLLCKQLRRRVYERLLARSKTKGEPMPSAEEVDAETRELAKAAARAKSRRCLYCGRHTLKDYCVECRRSGMANVHKVTGRTNGWDKTPTAKPETAAGGGWRGRPCMGGGIQWEIPPTLECLFDVKKKKKRDRGTK